MKRSHVKVGKQAAALLGFVAASELASAASPTAELVPVARVLGTSQQQQDLGCSVTLDCDEDALVALGRRAFVMIGRGDSEFAAVCVDGQVMAEASDELQLLNGTMLAEAKLRGARLYVLARDLRTKRERTLAAQCAAHVPRSWAGARLPDADRFDRPTTTPKRRRRLE